MLLANNNILQIPTDHILIEHLFSLPLLSAYLCRKGFIKTETILIQW